MRRRCGAAAAAAAAAAAGFLLSFPYSPHSSELPDGRVEVNWEGARAPRLIQAFNWAVAPWQRRLFPLDAASVLSAAREATGLSDFGDEAVYPFRDGLDHFLRYADDPDKGLPPLARFYRWKATIGYLSTRLRVRALTVAHPEILRERVDDPVFIVGLPRTGTTHLLNLLSELPDVRTLPLWELLAPLRPEGGDSRVRTAEVAMLVQRYWSPLFPLMHPMGASLPHEDIHLLAVSFASWMLETMANNGTLYSDWYESTDHSGAYRYFHLLLQVLQWQDRSAQPPAERAGWVPRRWLLKTPQHSEQMAALLAAFPTARVVATHRDPVPVIRSFITLNAYGNIGACADCMGAAHPPRIAAFWAPRLERMLRRAVAGRRLIADEQVVDVHFADLVADNLREVRRICAALRLPLPAATEEAVRRRAADSPRGKRGTVRYDSAPLRLNDTELAARVAFYREHFGVAEEPLPR